MPALMSKRGKPEAELASAAEPSLAARLEGIPLEMLLTTVRGRVHIEVDDSSKAEIVEAAFTIDGGPTQAMERAGTSLRGHFDAENLEGGEHRLELTAKMADGTDKRATATFRVRQDSP